MSRALHLAAAALNRGIRSSATARRLAGELEGQSLGVATTAPRLRLRIAIADGCAAVAIDEQPADAELVGSPLALQQLLLDDPMAALRSGRVEARGDTEVAERFGELLRMAGPDFEELLSRLVGDVAAHEIGSAARQLSDWAGHASRSLGRSLTEYLQEERRDTPTRFELREFVAEVDVLANDVERAAARVARLAARLDS